MAALRGFVKLGYVVKLSCGAVAVAVITFVALCVFAAGRATGAIPASEEREGQRVE